MVAFGFLLGALVFLRGWTRTLGVLTTASDFFLPETFRTGLIRSLTTLYPDTRREHHPAAPHACELPSRQCPRRLPRPSPRRPRTRFLPRATRPHSRNPHLGHWTIPANLPIARPTALPVPPVRMPPYPRFGFSPEAVSEVRPSFSPPPFSAVPSSSPTSCWGLPSS